ncbi:MAG: hypothetical protein M1836_005051 [Candelina mexicana]|nr:MAG: hypothetical protein M1836_005051 [Candelina mexicana]
MAKLPGLPMELIKLIAGTLKRNDIQCLYLTSTTLLSEAKDPPSESTNPTETTNVPFDLQFPHIEENLQNGQQKTPDQGKQRR